MKPRARSLLLAASAGAACFVGACSPDEAPRPRPARVILLSCDTLRSDRLGFGGYGRDTSPNLDALARRAVVFDAAYASAPMTQPALSSLMTGRLPADVGAVPGNRVLLPGEVETLAEILAAEGYATAAVVSNWILRRRADAPDVGVSQGFQHFDDEMPDREGNRGMYQRDARATTDAALAWLASRPSERFFLWVHYQDPHGPYEPPAAYLEQFLREPPADEAGLPVRERGAVLGPGQIPLYQVLGDERRPSVYADRYDAEVRYFDAELGRLLEALEAEGLIEDALLVFTADHGEALGEHDLWFCHGESLHRGVVQVPLIVSAPAGLPLPARAAADGTRRVDALAGHVDLLPTVLDALDLRPRPTRGVSLLTPELPAERTLVSDLVAADGRPSWSSIQDARFRLVWSELEPTPQLFDVRADPGEREDLAARHPERVRALAQQHAQLTAQRLGDGPQGHAMRVSEQDAQALDALGYSSGDEDE